MHFQWEGSNTTEKRPNDRKRQLRAQKMWPEGRPKNTNAKKLGIAKFLTCNNSATIRDKETVPMDYL